MSSIREVRYMLNVDFEGGSDDCRSPMHAHHGPHDDITVHAIGANHRGSADRETRYWLDNDGTGYTLSEVEKIIEELCSKHPGLYARRCRIKKCGIGPHLPFWD